MPDSLNATPPDPFQRLGEVRMDSDPLPVPTKRIGRVYSQQEVDAMQARIAELDQHLQSLTPGGSEYVNDPVRCVDWVKYSRHLAQSRLTTVVKRAYAAEARVAELEAALRKLQAMTQEVINTGGRVELHPGEIMGIVDDALDGAAPAEAHDGERP